MVIDPVEQDADPAGWEIRWALFAIGIKEEQAFPHGVQGIACQRLVCDLIVDILRVHIPHILRIIPAVYGIPHTDKLPLLFHNAADVAALADPEELAVRHSRTVHNDGCYCPHTVLPFPARLTLNQPRQKFAIRISHTHHLIFRIVLKHPMPFAHPVAQLFPRWMQNISP